MANTLKFGNGEWYGKKDTILAYNDENSNYKPLPFDFSRASSATVINKDGLIEKVGSDMPRIDYKDDSEGALLLEPSRTNYITYSENLNGANWRVHSSSGGTATRTLNYGISPDGKLNSTRVVFSDIYTSLYFTTSINAEATASMYVKGVAGETIGFGFGQSVAGGFNFVFNGEWQRLDFTSNSINYPLTINTWADTRNARDFEVYGVQMEIGSYATSYIPTKGSAVTRLADVCSQTTPDGVIGQTEGVLYCEVDVKSGYDTNNLIVTLSDGTNLKQIYINRSNGKLEFFVGTNVNELLYVSPSILTNGVHKLALAYKQNDFAVAIDGVIAHTDNSGNVPTCNKINVGSHYNGSLPFNDRINDIKLYNTRLTNAELQALTT